MITPASGGGDHALVDRPGAAGSDQWIWSGLWFQGPNCFRSPAGCR